MTRKHLGWVPRHPCVNCELMRKAHKNENLLAVLKSIAANVPRGCAVWCESQAAIQEWESEQLKGVGHGND